MALRGTLHFLKSLRKQRGHSYPWCTWIVQLFLIVIEEAPITPPPHHRRDPSPEYESFPVELKFPSCLLPGTDCTPHLHLIYTHTHTHTHIKATRTHHISAKSWIAFGCHYWALLPVFALLPFGLGLLTCFWLFSACPDLDCLLDSDSIRLPRFPAWLSTLSPLPCLLVFTIH